MLQITILDPSIAFANAYVALIYATYYLRVTYPTTRSMLGMNWR